MSTLRAIGYTRCSTNEQADSGLGLESQSERIRAYCTMRSLDLLDLICDPGVSGGKPLSKRDGGMRLLHAPSPSETADRLLTPIGTGQSPWGRPANPFARIRVPPGAAVVVALQG